MTTSSNGRIRALSCALLCLTAGTAHAQHGAAVPGYTPHRVYDTAAGRFIDFEAFAARAAAVDVVFFGEQHGHEPVHRMQHALLEALARRAGATLSLEMFERDVAQLLSAYIGGAIDEPTLLADARPWPRYATDYRPQVEEARVRGWRVVAANVPRAIASAVAQHGVAALDTLNAARRQHAARDVDCPRDDYRARFIAEMNRHPVPGSAPDDTVRLQRYYESQCVKDETMAESIVTALAAGAWRPIVHLTGAFHSDYGDGIPARVLRRRPETSIVSITVVPVPDLDRIDLEEHAARADYLLFTLSRRPGS